MIKISGLIIWWRSLGRKLVSMDLMLREELEEDILPMVYLALESNMSQVLLFLFHLIVCLVLFVSESFYVILSGSFRQIYILVCLAVFCCFEFSFSFCLWGSESLFA